VSVFDTGNPYHLVEIRGTAELVEDTGKSLPKALSRKYLGEDPPPEPDEVVRLIVRVTPDKVNIFSVQGALGLDQATTAAAIAACQDPGFSFLSQLTIAPWGRAGSTCRGGAGRHQLSRRTA
jgi:hypothetical protein